MDDLEHRYLRKVRGFVFQAEGGESKNINFIDGVQVFLLL